VRSVPFKLQLCPSIAGLRSASARKKYEKGSNRIGASRLQHMSQILQVPVSFFFEGVPGGVDGAPGTPIGANEFLATSDGLALARAFMRIPDAKLRQAIVGLAENCAAETV